MTSFHDSDEHVRVTPVSDHRADIVGRQRCAMSEHGVYLVVFANGLVASRAKSMKSCTMGLSVRFFRVMILTGQAGIGKFTGRTLSGGIAPNRNKEPGTIARKDSRASRTLKRWRVPIAAPLGGNFMPLVRNAFATRAPTRVSGDGKLHGSLANSESSILRRRAHLFFTPVTTNVR